ncbi:hypothetical protein PROFUN_00367 [Planoprotostelium fungivorum]|uniref:Uncharacterized protein n=1 Tax=Planoprotostelium fungivorum TaxID=1890364 RepID=A0A2P6NY81_9EUKA|nr:hypothetical protein PROFUN_00367 [Planoprotostelium fungivorum]
MVVKTIEWMPGLVRKNKKPLESQDLNDFRFRVGTAQRTGKVQCQWSKRYDSGEIRTLAPEGNRLAVCRLNHSATLSSRRKSQSRKSNCSFLGGGRGNICGGYMRMLAALDYFGSLSVATSLQARLAQLVRAPA